MIIEDHGDHYTVSISHCVTIGKADPLFNFKQYLQDIFGEFDKELTKTLYAMVSNPESPIIKP